MGGLLAGTAVWAVALAGYLNGPLNAAERILYGAAAVASILFPTRSTGWTAALVASGALCVWSFFLKPRLVPAERLQRAR
jgi:hypothetical protein